MSSPEKKFDVAIIGGGPGGVEAAKVAGSLGASVALIEQGKPGGRALWHSLVPSKVWLDAANLIGNRQHMQDIGLDVDSFDKNTSGLLERLKKVKELENSKNVTEFEKHGISVIQGAGKFTDEHTLKINDGEQTISADKFIIATGSVPIFPPDLKPDGKRILAPRFMSDFNTVPESIIVVGGGVTGSETIYLFNRLGARVTAITDIDELLPRSDQDVSQELENIFVERGVELRKNTPVKKIENLGDSVKVTTADGSQFEAEYAFVAIGRKPDLANLALSSTSIKHSEKEGISVDDSCRTSVSHIFAIGDVAGPPMLANRAISMGRVAAWNAVKAQDKTYKHKLAVEVVYTEPEVGQVGLNGKSAAEQGIQYSTRIARYNQNLKANISSHREGFLKLLLDESTKKILGASAVGYHAGDILAPIAVAIEAGLCLDDLLSISPANPTLSELLVETA